MTRLTQLLGQPTISLANAEQTGRVDGVEVSRGRVTGLRTRDGLVEASAIRSFEGDAVTYDGVVATVEGKADSPIGRRVLDEDGDELGRMADLEITADGTVTTVLLNDGRTIAGSALRAIGSYAAIVAANPDTTLTDTRDTLPPPPTGSTPA